MCLLCTEIAKKTMTVSEVARALMELVNEDPEDEHIDVIFNVVYKDYDKDKFDKALRAIP